jgi:phosphoenolpyruvate carboxykinase (ATP)
MSPPGSKFYHNLTAAELFERALAREEGHVSENGASVVLTGQHAGRSASDNFVARDAAMFEYA